MPASRIAVEISGSSSSLQEAVARAADSLKGLGDELARQSGRSRSLSDQILRSNERVAASYRATSGVVRDASERSVAAWSREADAAMSGADRVAAASDRIAAAALRGATVVRDGALEQERAARTVADAYGMEARAADDSTGRQVAANRTAADSSRAAAAQHARAAKDSAAAFGASGSALTRTGRTITMGLLGTAAASVYMAARFQSATTQLQTQAGATARQVSLLRAGMLRMAGDVGQTPDQLAAGMYHIVSSMNALLPAAHRAGDELHILRIAAEGAAVGHTSLEGTTYALASAINALHAPASRAAEVMGELNGIVGAGDMTMQDLLDSLQSGIIPTAQTFGISFKSVGAALAVMGDMGMRGALAGTRLRMSLALLAAPSEKAAKLLEAIGMGSQQATARTAQMQLTLEQAGLRTTTLAADLRQPNGILVALADLNRHLVHSGLSAQAAGALVSDAFGGGRSGASIQLLEHNLQRVNLKFDQIGHTTKSFGHDFGLASQTLTFQLHQIEGGAESIGVTLGNMLIPAVEHGIQDLKDLAAWFEHNHAALISLEAILGTFATVTIGSYFTSKVRDAIKLTRDFRSAVQGLGRLLGVTSAAGPGAAARAVEGQAAASMGIWGARGPSQPGSIANPIVVAMEAGEYAGLSSMGAAGTVATEEHAAQAEVGAAEAGAGARAASGAAAAETAAITGGEAAATGGLVAGIKGALPDILSGVMKGGMVALGGQLASQIAGGLVGGNAGHIVSSVGGDAAMGAGIGATAGSVVPVIGTGIGAAGGAIAGAIAGGITELLKSNYGRQIAGDVFSHGFGGTGARRAADSAELQRALNNIDRLTHLTRTRTVGATRAGQTTDTQNVTLSFAQLHGAKLDQLLASARKAGDLVAGQLEAGWAQYKFQAEPIMFEQLRSKLEALPASVRMYAAESAVKFAEGLQSQGKLTQGSVQALLEQIEQTFPSFTKFMGSTGQVSVAAFNRSFDLHLTEQQTNQTLQQISQDFPQVQQAMSQTAGGVQSQAASVIQTLQTIVGNGTRPMREQATQDLDRLRDSTTADFQAMTAAVLTGQGQMTREIESGSSQAAQAAGTSLSNLTSEISKAMGQGVLLTSQGTQDIAKALNATLQAFGAKGIPMPSAIQWAGWAAGNAPASSYTTGAGIGHRAAGGYVGGAGERGRDQVLTVLGRGEAILNHHQQQVVNGALAAQGIAGLPDLFSRITTPHYMAGGGFAGYSLPLPRSAMMPGAWSIDQGVDIPAAANTPEFAIGAGTIIREGIQGFGPNAPVLRLDKPIGGISAVYYGHAGPDLVRVGAHVKAGQQISEVGAGIVGISSGPHIEFGTWPLGPMGAGSRAAGLLRMLMGSAGTAGAPAGAGALAGLSLLNAPGVKGDGAVAELVRAALARVTAAANHKLTAAGGTSAATTVGKLVPGILRIEEQAARIAGVGWDARVVRELLSKESSGGVNEPPTGPLQATGPNQVIPSTFAAYRLPRYGPITNPLANAIASMRYIRSRYGSLENMAQTVGLFGPGYVGYSTGGYVQDAYRHGLTIRPPRTIATPKAPKVKAPGRPPKAPGGLLTVKDMQNLAKVGGQISVLEATINRLTGTYTADQTLFGPQEQASQYLNPDGSTNAAGYAKVIGDDQTLLGIDRQLLTLYQQEVPIVSQALSKWLGSQSHLDSRIESGKRKIAANKIRESSLRKAIADLSRPVKDTVGPIEDQIKNMRLGWEGRILAGEKAKLRFDETSVPRELGLEQAVIDAQRKKLTYSALGEANSLKRQVLSAVAAEKAYAGSDTTVKKRLSDTVEAARNTYSNFLLGQAPIKQALSNATSTAAIALRQYLLAEKPTRQQLTDAITGDRLSEQSALLPLERALTAAESARRKRAQKIKAEKFHLGQQLRALTTEDLHISQADTSMTGILTGAGGGVSTNTTVNLLEGVAGRLGMIDWASGGVFAGIDTSMPGEIVSVKADIQSLVNAIGQAGKDQGAAGSATTDQTQLLTLLQQQNATLAEELAISTDQTAVLRGMLPTIPSYDTGGPVIDDTLANVHAGEYVVPTGGALVMRGGQPSPTVLELHQHYDGHAAALMSMIDQRIRHPENVKVVSLELGRRTSLLAGRPGR